MERLRSLSFKPTILLVFSFTIFSSIIFLSSSTIWVIKSTPSIGSHSTHLQFNTSSLNVDLRPSTFQALTGFTRNSTVTDDKIQALIENDLDRLQNSSKSKSEVPEDGGRQAVSLSSNFTAMQGNAVHETSPGRVINEERKTIGGLVGKTLVIDSDKEAKKMIATLSEKKEVKIRKKIEQKKAKGCDLTKGSWVFDESYPLYTKDSCPFIDEGFDCKGNGRMNRNYSKWRWQPQGCDLPRFNATKMLELIRGKRMVFVGDSINRNQWESMLCMLMGAIRDPKRVFETHGRKITKEKGNYSFKFLDYKCTVEYYVSHFLVQESKARIEQKRRQTLRIDAIDHGSTRWRGADVLIFNTAHWWSHYKTKAGIYYYQEGSVVHPKLNVSTAFRKALMTWASWVDKHINPRRTQVFFRSPSPSHYRGGQWNSGGHCKEATHPLNETFSTRYPEKNIIMEEVIRQMRTPVTLLNMTRLSEYRIDGHPSIYGRKTEKRGQSSSIQDCSHWCLPGVPDTWNELLYFHLQIR